MATATMNISLPDSMRAEVEAIVESEGFGNTSEFIRTLVRSYLRDRQERELELLLLKRLQESDVREFDIAELRGELKKRLGKAIPRTK